MERPKQQVKPHSTALQPGLHITHDVDACRTAEGQHQLEVRWHQFPFMHHGVRSGLQVCKLAKVATSCLEAYSVNALQDADV